MEIVRRRRLLRIGVFALALMVMVSMMAINTNESYGAAKKPAKVTGLKLTKKTATTLVIKWSKAKNAKKYQVAYKKKGAKKYSYVKTTKKNCTIKKLKASTTYYVKVRGINGKKYGKWSKTCKWKTNAAAFDYSKAANESKVKVSVTDDHVTIAVKSLGKSGTGTLYSTNANKYRTGDKMRGLVSKTVSGTKIGTLSLNGSKTFTIDRYDGAYDRLYDKYYIVQSDKIIKGPIYATKIASDIDKVEMNVSTKKGIVDELREESFTAMEDLGCKWTAENINFTDLILANETDDGTPIDNSDKYADTIEVNGKTYYMNMDYVNTLDSRLSRFQDMGINVVGIVISFVSTEARANYPRALKYIDDARWTNGFNTSTEMGRDYFIAGMEYLANRYSKGDKGLICNYVIGNEISYAYDWNEIIPNKSKSGKALPPREGSDKNLHYLRDGEIETTAPFDTYMEEYSRALRLANLAVKKYSSDITVGVCITREWARSVAEQGNLKAEENKRFDSYRPMEILNWLNYYSKKSGDFDWTLTPHNYPIIEDGNAAAYETGLTGDKVRITGDPDNTRAITQNNLEVLQLFLNRSYHKYNSKVREVYFTENGCSTGTEIGTPTAKQQKQQAAAVAQYYYRAASLPSVKAIIYYKITDREEEGATAYKLGLKDTTGTNKLAYDVWKYIDTAQSFTVTKEYLPYISFKKNGKTYSTAKGNIKSFRDVMSIVDSKYDWSKNWNEDALTPMK